MFEVTAVEELVYDLGDDGPQVAVTGLKARLIGGKKGVKMERREAIRATYQTFGGRVSEYELHPYHLLAYHGNWYVLALNTAKAQMGTFALSRFRRIEAAGQTFASPVDFHAEAFARQAFGIVGGEETIEVRLLFAPKLAVYLTERQCLAVI
jgi:predicted DNA-binding transcriptional regulator YafY